MHIGIHTARHSWSIPCAFRRYQSTTSLTYWYIYINTHTYTHVYTYTYIDTHRARAQPHWHIDTCIYIYIHIHTHTHIYICIHRYTPRGAHGRYPAHFAGTRARTHSHMSRPSTGNFFSKISSPPNWVYQIAIELTFWEFFPTQTRWRTPHPSTGNILQT